MRAVVVTQPGGPEVLSVKNDVPDPRAGPGEIVIDVEAAGLNGADLQQRQGIYPPPPGASETLGLEVCGVVETLGEGVEGFQPGERVIALLDGGGYAEKAVAPVGQVMKLPPGLTPEQGAAIPETFITAHLELVRLGELRQGESVMVHAGGSGVGTSAIQIARVVGASPIIATAGSNPKLELAKSLGATRGVNYKEENWEKAVHEETRSQEVVAVPGGPITGIRGVDVILDLVGASYFERNIASLGVGGRLLLVGLPSGSDATIHLDQVLAKRLKVIGSTLRARPQAEKSSIVQEFAQRFLPLFQPDAGGAPPALRPVVDRVFPLEEVRQAHEYMESKKNMGKIILKVKP